MGTGGRVLVAVRNITDATNDAYITSTLKNGYQVRRILQGESPLPVMEQEAPLVTCFQYDYPDLPGLAELRLVKERMPSVPLLMITQAHSELLAVWAFRAGVRDFFVQPVDVDRFLCVLDELSAIRPAHGMRRRPLRGTLTPPNVIPPEARMRIVMWAIRRHIIV
jgi:DNA-binding NtrC family response regulator